MPSEKKKGKKTSNASRTKKGPAAAVKKTAAIAKVAASSGEPAHARKPDPPTGNNTTWLSDADLDKFRQTLLAKRKQLAGDVSHMQDDALKKSRKDASGDLSSMPIHMADIGSDNYEQEFTLGLIENEQGLLREIEEALERVENRTYGRCLATGKRITKARLKIKPWAKYCVEHARKTEKSNNFNGS